MLKDSELKSAASLLERSESVFLALPESPSPDTLAGAELIARRLEKLGKAVGVSSTREDKKWEFLPLETLRKSSGLNRELVIMIDTKTSPVGEIKYEKSDDSLQIILSPKDKPLSRDAVSVNASAAKADCIIVLGSPALDSLGTLFQKNPRLFFETPVINIDHSFANERFGEINLVDMKASSAAEICWRLAKVMLPEPMDKNEATLILAGIISTTDNFLDGKVLPDTLALAAEALMNGGDRTSIVEAVGEKKALPIFQLWGRAAIRTRFDEKSSTLVSMITADDFNKTGTTPDEVFAIVRHFEEHLHMPQAFVLLWQDPKTSLVSAGIKSPYPEIMRGARRALSGVVRQGLLILAKTYFSFKDAEVEIMAGFLRENQKLTGNGGA